MALKRSHITFIMNLKKQGKGWKDISEAYAKKFGIERNEKTLESTYRRYKDDYDMETVKSTVEVKSELMRDRIMNDFLKMTSVRKYVPTTNEFHQHSQFNRDAVSRYYGSFDNLVKKAREEDPGVFENIIDEESFDDEAFTELRDTVAEHRVFVITSAVTGRDPFMPGLKAIETYCKSNDAALLILPCSDPAAQKDAKAKWQLSHKLPKKSIVFRDLPLNDNIILSTIKMSAKQLQPLTGLKRIGKNAGTVIVASPKQFLEYNTVSNKKQIPRGLASTGAITLNDYRTEMYMSERTAYLAEVDHVYGGWIVEVKNGKIFHMRNFRIDARTGAFCDIDRKYHASGKVEKITAELVQLPDYHVLSTDPVAKQVAKEICEAVRPDFLTLEDFFDGITINPHERHNFVSKSKNVAKNLDKLEFELKSCRDEINDLCGWPVKNLIMKYGNHEDFLRRYIADGAFMDDPQNKILAMKLNIAMEEQGKMPFEYAMKTLFGLKEPDRVKFLTINDSFKVNDIENGVHGHMGKGGSRNPGMAGLEECYGAGNFGHNHSAAIWRDVFRVGTLTHLQLSYNDGPSAWTQTMLIQHRDGSRQLINNINGEWRLED